MFFISKRFEFSAAHQLTSLQGKYLPDGAEHPCARLHGHNYVVTVELLGHVLDEHGMVLDYHLLQPFKTVVDGFDHTNLNDFFNGTPATAECLARYFFQMAESLFEERVSAISVEETPRTKATYRR